MRNIEAAIERVRNNKGRIIAAMIIIAALSVIGFVWVVWAIFV